MSNYPIVRMYAAPEQAELAVAALKSRGFEQEWINLVTASSKPPANAPASAASDDPVLSSILAGYVLKAHAKVYAEEVRRGHALVSIQPRFGTGGMAEQLMDEYDPVESALVIERDDALRLWDDATPFSSTFGIPVLVRASAPFSAFWVLPVIVRRLKSLGGALGISEVTRASWYLFGEPQLSRSTTPLSSVIGLPLLTK